VIIGEDCIAIVHFERFSRGNQLNDLYQFSRKVMEKSNYDFALLKDILNAYSETINLNSEDYEYLYILFSYPEKFWKIANSYYNSSKAFLSPKYIEKLENVICQENEKKEMLDRMKGIVFGSV
jgi:spore coat protein I